MAEPSNLLIFFMFMLMGAGANWIAIAAIWQEIPYFIEESSAGLCVGTFMNLANNAGFLMVILYFMILRKIRPVPHSISIPIIFISGSFSVFLALAYRYEVGGVSLFIYLPIFLAGSVGAVGAVVLPQFLANFKKDLITAGCVGGNAGIVLTSIVGIAQSPGGANRFSAQVFLLIFAVLLIFPIFAYFWIVHNKVGLSDEALIISNNPIHNISKEAMDSPISRGPQMEPKTSATTRNSAFEVESNAERMRASDSIIDHLTDLSNDLLPMPSMHNSQLLLTSSHYISSNRFSTMESKPSIYEQISATILSYLFVDITEEDLNWMSKSLPYALALGLCDFCAFGIVSSASPFSFDNTSGTDANLLLGLSIELGGICLVLGDLSTIFCRIPLIVTLPLMIFFTLIFVLTAFGTMYVSPYALIIFYALINFVEAHVLTTIYRCVAMEFPVAWNQKAARLIGFMDGFLNTLGAIISFIVVVSLVSCSG